MTERTGEAQDRSYKERLVRSGRMYAMCQRAGVEEPLLPVSLALAAFEEISLEEATSLVRTNRTNLEDLAWAFSRSESPEEFEEKLHQRLAEAKGQLGQRRVGSGG